MAQINVKTEAEIAAMRRSCRAAAEVLAGLKEIIAPGITTRDIDAVAKRLIEERGGKSPFLGYRGYPGYVCVSVNEEVVHGIPGPRRIQYGDIISLDVGIVLDGWIGDNAATVAVGIVAPRAQELLQVTNEALYIGMAQARAGNRVGDISAAIQQYVEKHGFSVVREFVGHGVGRTMHEEPQIPNFGEPNKGAKLKRGMTLAIEPMVNMGKSGVEVLADGWTVVTKDRLPSAHFEHTILVTDSNPEILTWLEKSPYVWKAG